MSSRIVPLAIGGAAGQWTRAMRVTERIAAFTASRLGGASLAGGALIRWNASNSWLEKAMMIARTCAAQVARQIVRALHVSVDEVPAVKPVVGERANARARERVKPKGRKKKKLA